MKISNLLLIFALFITACSSSQTSTEKNTVVPAAPQVDEIEDLPDTASEERSEPKAEEKSKEDYYEKFSQAMHAHQYKNASYLASQILSRNSKDIKVLNGLTVMSIEQGKYDLAKMFIGKVLEQDPQNSASYNNLGVIELKLDNLRLALVQFKKAIDLDSSNKSAHANLGAIYLQYRNYSSAAEELRNAVDEGDKSPEVYTNLGFALKGLGKYSDAESAYEKALNKDSNNVVTLLNYASLLAEHTKDSAKALKMINKLRFVAKDPAIIEKANQLAQLVRRLNGKTP